MLGVGGTVREKARDSTLSAIDFERLANRHKAAVYRQLIRLCGNYDDAEDALVAALVAAFRASAQLREEESFRAWLSSIARRACLRIKHKKPLLEISADSGLVDFETLEIHGAQGERTEVEEAILRECIHKAIDRIPTLYRQAYTLCELDGLDDKEAAARLQITVPALKSRLHRARAMARAFLDEALCI